MVQGHIYNTYIHKYSYLKELAMWAAVFTGKNWLFCFRQSDPCPNLCKYLVKGKEIYSDMPARIKHVNAQIVLCPE